MKEITTNGITILLVEVPEDAKAWSIKHHMDGTLRSLRVSDNETNYELCVLPIGQYQILGKSTELSEEQMKEICWQVSFGNYTGYKNYNQAKCSDFRDIVESSFSTVQESYLSLLEANGIVDRNNLTNPDTTSILGSSPSGIDYEILDELTDKYQESQSKVKHYLVLKRI